MVKLLSVIIPTYNMELYLRRCLDSLLVSGENMALLEVLIINDGSMDASSAIAHTYESDYPQTFRVIDKANGNYGSCINRGLKEARGQFVRILDADDYYQTGNLDQFFSANALPIKNSTTFFCLSVRVLYTSSTVSSSSASSSSSACSMIRMLI